jgi:hypothetical protein
VVIVTNAVSNLRIATAEGGRWQSGFLDLNKNDFARVGKGESTGSPFW